ncbi:MAG: hypothetical protein ACYS26_00335 [Planctomycetota bacterium]|jgi:hypothetical protein
MRSQLRTSVLVAGFVLSAPLALADITVGPEGSGAQTDSISDAIFNADEGETIFVFAGEYTNIRVIGKSVRIIGEGPDLVTFAFDDPSTFGPGNRIEGLGPEQSAFFSGVAFDQKALSGLNGPLSLVANRGALYFHDCDFRSTGGSGQGSAAIFNCDDITFDQCSFEGFEQEPKTDPVSVSGGDGIYVESSLLRLNACTIEGGDALQSGLFFSQGGIGIEALDTTLVLHNTSVTGGEAQNSGVSTVGPGIGIVAGTSSVTVTGAATITGGSGGTQDPSVTVAGSPAISFLDGASSLTTSESVVLQPGVGSDGTSAVDVDLSGSLATVELFARPGLTPSAPSGAPGSSFTVAIDGEPSATQILALAFDTVLPYEFDGVAGAAQLDPLSTELVGLVTLDGNGAASLSFDLPALPSLTGTCGFFQSLQSGAAGGSRLSLPTTFLVGQ